MIMNTLNKYIRNITMISLGIIMLIPFSSYAQTHIKGSYDLSFPIGNTRDYISEMSPRGWSFGLGYHITKQLAVGVDIGLHTFVEVLEADTYTDDNITLYGKQFRYINSFPAQVSLQYNTISDRPVEPYLKLGVGAFFFEQRTDMGIYSWTNDYNWNLGLRPEVGVMFPVFEKVKLSVLARYNYLFENQSVDSQGYFNIGVGMVLVNLGEGSNY